MDAGVCNSKQRLNVDRCRCKCKELIDNGRCDTGFIWNPSNCDCECDKSCDVGEYLDYQNCVRILKIVDKLVKECNEMNYNEKKFIKYLNKKYEKINIKNYSYYIITLLLKQDQYQKTDPNLLSINKLSFKTADSLIYNIKCITMKSLYTVYIIHRSIYIHECGYEL